MSCYHPLKAFKIGVHVSGKDKYKICSYDTHHVTQYSNDGGWIPVSEPFYGSSGIHRSEFIEIPCGKCLGCRLDYSRQWANRCMMELEYHESSYFLTLTYDEHHVPLVNYDDDAEDLGMTLCKRDFQLFMKRLRKALDYPVRFFACGEYGIKTYRPHYHVIIFGLKLDDLEYYSKRNGYIYYTSEFLSSIWKNGHVVVGEVNWNTCAYTARYIMKKVDGIDKFLMENFGVEPEFTLMSRKPGIARQYYEDHPDIYDYDSIVVSTPKGGMRVKPPRYFDNIFDIENHDLMVDVKNKRKLVAKDITDAKLNSTNLSKLEMLQVEEYNMRQKTKKLIRDL